MLTSLHLDLTQCTGVINVGRLPGPASPLSKVTAHETRSSVEGSQAAQGADQRQPLHEHNSQTYSSSQKQSPNTSESMVVTPAEKRQTVLVLSPERPLPPGDRYDTLEVQRALSLSPRSRRSSRDVCDKPSSLDSLPDPSLTSSLAKLQASPSQKLHNATAAATAQHGSQGRAEHQAASDNQLVINPVSLRGPHTVDIPPTQLDCTAATALDLLQCEATQLIPFAPTSASPHSSPTVVVCRITATDASAPTDNAAILLMPQGKGFSLSDTPVLLPAPQTESHAPPRGAITGSEAVLHNTAPQIAAPVAKHQQDHPSTALEHNIKQLASADNCQVDSNKALQLKPISKAAEHHTAGSDEKESCDAARAGPAAGVASALQTGGGCSPQVRPPAGLATADMALQDNEISSQVWTNTPPGYGSML